MSQRESRILWMKDLIAHLSRSQEQLQWTDDPETIRLLTESMLGDLESCRRLCEEMHGRARLRQAV